MSTHATPCGAVKRGWSARTRDIYMFSLVDLFYFKNNLRYSEFVFAPLRRLNGPMKIKLGVKSNLIHDLLYLFSLSPQ